METGQTISRFARNPRIEEAPLQHELMLFDPESSKFFVLNQTMAFVWKNLSDTGLDDLAARISESFSEITQDRATDDIRHALDELIGLGLIIDHSDGLEH